MPRRRSTLNVPSTAGGSNALGERRVFDDLFTAVYDELRRLASSVRRGEPTATLTPTALVNEAWLKLARCPQAAQTSRAHFKGIAAYAMRQVLVEAARRRNAKKRGEGVTAVLIPLDESVEPQITCSKDILALDAALQDLAKFQPRQAAVVEGRFFGGLDLAELSQWLNVSPSTVRSDWRVARAWLSSQLSRD